MSKITNRLIQPKYYKYFQCDPVACKETCCQRWQIFIDRETCLSYLNSPHHQIQALAKTGIVLNPEALGDEDYAMIKMNKELFCPFLNEDDLCQIVIHMGDQALSKTCRTFPRAIKRIGHLWERGLVMSCSLACDLALTREEGMILEEGPIEPDHVKVNVNTMSEFTEDELATGLLLREHMLRMMQNRDQDLTSRVGQIGNFLTLAKERIQPETMSRDEIEVLVAGAARDAKKVNRTQASGAQQFHHLNQILSMKFQEGDSIRFFSSRYIECLMAVLDAYGEVDEKEISSVYQAGEVDYLNPFLQRKGYIIENYLANYLFVYCHEFFDWERLWQAYVKFALIFGLLKFNLIGLGIANEGLDDETVLKLIQSLAKTFVPDGQYFYAVRSYLEEEDLEKIQGISMIIGNTESGI